MCFLRNHIHSTFTANNASASLLFTRRMAIANGTCVSFCNQPKAHFGLPLVRPWDNRGKCQWMKRGLNACQKHRSMHPSVFNRFPVIQPVTSKVRYFSTFLHMLASPGYATGQFGMKISVNLQEPELPIITKALWFTH